MLSSLMISTEIPLISVTINLKKQLVGREYAILDTFITKLVTQRGGYPTPAKGKRNCRHICRAEIRVCQNCTTSPETHEILIARRHNARRR